MMVVCSVAAEAAPRGILGGGIVSLGERAVVVSSSPRGGCTLWGTDGTSGGTRALTELPSENGGCTDSENAITFHPIVIGRDAWFLWRGDRASERGMLWHTDGTASGSREIRVGAGWDDLVALGDRVLLLRETSRGTRALVAYTPSTNTFEPLAIVGPATLGVSAFTGTWSLGGRHFVGISLDETSVWETNGTAAGTARFTAVPQLTHPGVEQGARQIFVGSDGSSSGLWTTDGTAAGTSLIEATTDDGKTFAWPDDLLAVGGSVLFTHNAKGTSAADTVELAAVSFAGQRHTIAAARAMPAKANRSDTLTWPPRAHGVFGGWLGSRGGEALYLWQTEAGPTELRSIGSASSAPHAVASLSTVGWVTAPLVEVGNRFVFATTAPAALPSEARQVIYGSDGTPSGTQPLVVTHSALSIAKVGGRIVLFDGASLATTDGSIAGTHVYATLFDTAPSCSRACRFLLSRLT